MTAGRLRADRVLVERGLFESRARAVAAIRAGLVHVDGRRVERASDLIVPDAGIEARAPHPYVSRGGLKLAAALDAFRLDPRERTCLDVGASTGGFTDVLLRRGARHVTALDVGRDQLHPSLRGHPRVRSLEGTDIRALDPATLPAAPDLVTVDVSFIGLRLVLPAVAALTAPDGMLVALIKPQFEAGRERVGRGGLVRDEAVHAAVCAELRSCLEGLGFSAIGLVPSPVAGGDGNCEFLIAAAKPMP